MFEHENKFTERYGLSLCDYFDHLILLTCFPYFFRYENTIDKLKEAHRVEMATLSETLKNKARV